MKTRSDFVSNSSSSSFIVSVEQGYDLSEFCKDVAKQSVDPTSFGHDMSLQHRNEVNLEFSLMNHQLLFLGSLAYSASMQTYQRHLLPDSAETEAGQWMTKQRFDQIANELQTCKPSKREFLGEDDLGWLSDDGATLNLVFKRSISNIGVSFDSSICICTRGIDNRLAKAVSSKKRKLRIKDKAQDIDATNVVKRIKDFCNDIDFGKERSWDSCEITMETVATTRFLLAAGQKLQFGKMTPDAVEKLLKSGNRLFCIRHNYQGDGYLRDGIYCEDDAEVEYSSLDGGRCQVLLCDLQ